MSRWADAFRASACSRDTVDSVDTSFPRPLAPEPCVNSVSSVMGSKHTKNAADRPLGNELSTVSAVSRAAKVVNAVAFLQRPPSWSDLVALPSRGCSCSCCKGQRWWCEREAPKGWRCSTCHPPSHMTPGAVTEVRT
jgi:hypothetical protein